MSHKHDHNDISEADMMRHSLAHILAGVIMELWPNTKLAIGPAVEDGFYYDVESDHAFTPDDFKNIEKRMRKIINKDLPFEGKPVSKAEALTYWEEKNQPYKVEILQDLEDGSITFYSHGDFTDLCRGGHTATTKQVGAFKLDRIAGAYWRGDEKNKMLQRIYGLAFPTEAELDAYLLQREEAKKRDHRKLGKELELFAFSDMVGPGLPLWLPNGTVLVEELEKLAKETEFRAGYSRVKTPHVAKEIMFKTSGHLPYYADSMFPPMVMHEDEGDTTYYLKAMNCPLHHQVYAAKPRSYRDLPLRLAEYGTCYRYEKSGELMGLMRVRSLNMNDAHMYCTPEQFADEFRAVNEMYMKYFKLFGFGKYVMRLSLHDPKELGKKYVDEPELWLKTEAMVRQVMIDSGINFVEVANEAAFYGPKIDVQVWSSIGREFTIATNQVDFAVPKRFGLTYKAADGTEQTPICIHRAPLGTHERFIGFLIEHYAGAFPVWLAPQQVRVASVAERHIPFCAKLRDQLLQEGIRVYLDDSNESVGKKIRNAEKMKVPYTLVVGDKEQDGGVLAVRVRSQRETVDMSTSDFISKVKKESTDRT
jgi:threonyl-tRNA synthetase